MILFCCATSLSAESLVVGQFSSLKPEEGLPKNWQPLTFKDIAKHTRYNLVRDPQAGVVVKAVAESSASGLMHSITVNPKQYPILRWRWKVENLLARADATKKSGDDYPARIYVSFAYDPQRVSFLNRAKYETAKFLYGAYPPHAGLNYIWEGKAQLGTMLLNPFTDRVMMIVVESSAVKLNQWVSYERNIYEDYKRAFGEEPPMISGIAVMTDADNTEDRTVAYYGDIELASK